jgi:hypothetical protein
VAWRQAGVRRDFDIAIVCEALQRTKCSLGAGILAAKGFSRKRFTFEGTFLSVCRAVTAFPNLANWRSRAHRHPKPSG